MTKQQLREAIRKIIKRELNESLTEKEKDEFDHIEDILRHKAKTKSAISPAIMKKYNDLKDKKKMSETKTYPVAGEKGYVKVSDLKKGDILGGSGLEVVSKSAGAKTESGKIEVTVKDPKTGKELTKTWSKSTTVRVKDKTNENAPAPSKPTEKPGPSIAPGKPGEKEGPRRPLVPKPVTTPIKNRTKRSATMEEANMVAQIVKRFKSKK